MKLSAPKVVTFIIAVVLALLAVVGNLVSIPLISLHPFWLLSIAFMLLVLANMINGL